MSQNHARDADSRWSNSNAKETQLWLNINSRIKSNNTHGKHNAHKTQLVERWKGRHLDQQVLLWMSHDRYTVHLPIHISEYDNLFTIDMYLLYKYWDLLVIKTFYIIRTCYIVNQSDTWYEFFHWWKKHITNQKADMIFFTSEENHIWIFLPLYSTDNNTLVAAAFNGL